MLDDILKKVHDGTMSVSEAKEKLSTYENLGFARVDHHRKSRVGFPEVIFGEGKSAEQILAIVQALKMRKESVLVTRISEEKAAYVRRHYPDMSYGEQSRTLSWKNDETLSKQAHGYIAVVCAGTSDLPVAEEAAVTAETMGSRVKRIYDVGVAGLHRLLDQMDDIRNADVTIVVAGMEGALPSVVGGLIANPIIAVPTSIGYGANFNGLSALLTMLNSCASGVSVVNIDNGFGAGYNAVLIHRLAQGGVRED